MNKVVISGNLTHDVEVKTSKNGNQFATCAIANNRKYKMPNGNTVEETTFLDVFFGGYLANTASTYLRKGSKVLLSGRLQQDRWTDDNGVNRQNYKLMVDALEFMDSPNTNMANTTTQQPATVAPAALTETEIVAETPETEIPF